MELTKEIFEKFIKNQCTDSEAREIQAYLKEHPDALEKYMPLDDWLADDKTPLKIEVSERMLQGVRRSYEPEKRPNITRIVVRYAAAAVLIGAVALGGMQLFTGRRQPAAEPTVASNRSAGVPPELRTVENRTRQAMRVTLSDSSIATLYPNSSIRYLPAFATDRRDLYLKGKAQFRITQDQSRPFTVYTGGIATTVLGTRFLVTEQSNKKVSVMLMEGRVKVWSQRAEDGNGSVILNPGDEVAVTPGQFSSYALVHNASRANTLAAMEPTAKNEAAETTNDLVFKNKKVKDVFKKIEERFGVTINDDSAKGIREKLFTGRFLEKDGIDFIAKTICNFYDLQYRIEGNIVTITAK